MRSSQNSKDTKKSTYIEEYIVTKNTGDDNNKIKLNLTEKEAFIFELIRKFAHTLPLNVTPRVVGGWVRDKLLNKESYDIDITVDTLSGYEFAVFLKSYLENVKMSDTKIISGEKNFSVSNIGVVKENPEKSKHLETAVLNIDGLSIDFLSLRSENYATSRIPITKMGTIDEDALRRDFTVNSLYYNLLTNGVEDILQTGLTDLNNRILRTPISPQITFNDDPLRMIRLLRFYSTLDNFTISDEILDKHNKNGVNFIKCPTVKENLLKKVSNERVGKEIEKIIKSRHFYKGINEILDNEILRIIFKIDQIEENYKKCKNYRKYFCLDKIFNDKMEKFMKYTKISDNEYYYFSVEFVKKLQDDLINNFFNIEETTIKEPHNKTTSSIKWDNIVYLRLYTLMIITNDIKLGKSFLNVKIIQDSLVYSKKIFSRIEKIEKNLQFLDQYCDDVKNDKNFDINEIGDKLKNFKDISGKLNFIKKSPLFKFIECVRFLGEESILVSIMIYMIREVHFLNYETNVDTVKEFFNHILEENNPEFKYKDVENLRILIKLYQNFTKYDYNYFKNDKLINIDYLTKEYKIANKNIKFILEDTQIFDIIFQKNTHNKIEKIEIDDIYKFVIKKYK